MGNDQKEIRELRRLIRDLVALATTPAVWVGRDRAQIAEGVADVLLHTLRADAVYVYLQSPERIEVVRSSRHAGFRDEVRRLWPQSATGSLNIDTITAPTWPGALRVAMQPFGISGDDGFIVVGCANSEFPNEAEALLLSVAANQAAVALQAARLRMQAELERYRLQDLLAKAPAAIGLLSGPEHRWVYVNQNYVRVTGRKSTSDFLGKTVREALPEIEGQGFLELLDEVYQTGIPHIGTEALAVLNRSANAQPEDTYFNFVFQPMRDAAGQVEGILVHAVEVTEQVLARREIENREQQFRNLAESIPQLVWMAESDGSIFWYNRRWYEYTGTTPEQMTGWGWQSVHDPNVLPRVVEAWKRSIQTGDPFEMTFPLRGADGEFREFLTRVHPVKDTQGSVVRWFGTNTDVTSQRRAEEALRESEQHLRAIIETTPECVKLVSPNGTLLHMNESGLTMVGASCAEMVVGKNVYDLIAPEDQGRFRDFNEGVCRGKKGSLEFDIVSLDGVRRHMDTNAAPLPQSDGTFIQLAVTRDITERKLAEMALRENERRFREMIDALPAAIYTTDAEGRITHFNPAAVEFSGRTPELGSDHWCVSWKLYYPDGRPMPHDECPMAVALKEGRIIRGAEAIAERPNGVRRWFTPYPTPIRDHHGRIIGGINMLLDITERKRAEEAIGHLAAIVASSDDAIVSKDLNGIIKSWNKSAERIFGYSAQEAIGQHITLIIPWERRKEEEDILRRLRNGERIDHFETVRRGKDGGFIDVSLTISPVQDASGKIAGASKVARDITESKRTQESLRQSQLRLAAEADALVKLNEWSGRLWRSRALKEGLDEMLGAVIELLGADKGNIQMLDSVHSSLTIAVQRGFDKEFLDSFREVRADDDSACGRALRTGERIVIEDVESDEPFAPFRQIARRSGFRAVISSPLRAANGTPLGIISVHFGAVRHPSEQDLHRLDLYVRQAADFIERCQMEDALRQSEERFRKLSESLDVEVCTRTRELEERNLEVLRQSEQVRELSWELLRSQDEERRHIARELHDSAGQLLTVLGIHVSTMAERTKEKAPELAASAQQAEELVLQLTKELRTNSYLLHPPLLDESGLPTALLRYIRGLRERSGLDIEFHISEEFGRLPEDMELLVFRLVQECLTNIHRHSGSKRAFVQVTREEPGIIVEVRDYGRGMSPEKLSEIQSSKGSGVGIRGMRERLRQFHGEMVIDSSNGGTVVLVTIPVSEREREIPQSPMQTLGSPV